MSRLCRISAKNWTFGFRLFSTLVRMNLLHIECPHCGSSFNVQLDGDVSNMMVFPCAKCQVPLMYYHGQISELDREEFANLRKRLSKVLEVVLKQDGSVNEIANSLKKMVDESTARADERKVLPAALSDDSLENLQKNLDDLDVDSFLDKL